MLYALYEAKLLDRAWLLSGMRPEKHFTPLTNSRKYSVSTLSCVVGLLFFCFKHVFLLRLLRVRTSLWVIKSFSHFRIDLFTFPLFSFDSNLLHFNNTNFFLFCCICPLARSLISVNYSRLCSIIEQINRIGKECVRGGSWFRSFQFCIPFAQIISAGNVFASYFSPIPFAIAIICGSLSGVSSFEVLQFVSAFARILAWNLLPAKLRAK